MGARRSSSARARGRSCITRSLRRWQAGASRRGTAPTDGPGFGGMGAVGVGERSRRFAAASADGPSGATPRMLPERLALRLPKGSDFLLQMHFHLSGKPETREVADRDLLCRQGAGKGSVLGRAAGALRRRRRHRHPARRKQLHDSRTRSRCRATFSVYSAMAHAHYLAKEMKATATLPDGSTKPLIWIHDWDFNWQDSYVYKEPFTLPKGTRIDVDVDLRQLGRQSAEPDQSAAARLVGRAVVRRDGHRRLCVRGAAQGGCPGVPAGARGTHEGGDCRRGQGWHARPFSRAPTATKPRPAAAHRLRPAGDRREPGGRAGLRTGRRRSRPTARGWR